MDFFGIGFGEILLIFLGPGKLVEFAQSIGRLSRNLRNMSSDFTTKISREITTKTDTDANTYPTAKSDLKTDISTGKEHFNHSTDQTNRDPVGRP